MNKQLYILAFFIGVVIMGFEMVASRYINPYLGSGIMTWAGLISVVLFALMIGYFTGGIIADKYHTPELLGYIIIVAALYLGIIPIAFDGVLSWLMSVVESQTTNIILGSFFLLFIPVALFGMFSPYAISLLLKSKKSSGRTAGFVYSISTLGNICGTLFTTFHLIPNIGSRNITFIFAAVSLICGFSLLCRKTNPQ